MISIILNVMKYSLTQSSLTINIFVLSYCASILDIFIIIIVFWFRMVSQPNANYLTVRFVFVVVVIFS